MKPGMAKDCQTQQKPGRGKKDFSPRAFRRTNDSLVPLLKLQTGRIQISVVLNPNISGNVLQQP